MVEFVKRKNKNIMCKIHPTMRRWFLGPMIMLWIGIYLTGFKESHWLIYIPAVMSIVASTTGYCLGLYLIKLRTKDLSNKCCCEETE